jgi:hypothetical protein
VQLTELKALLGCIGENRFVVGCISQLQDGRYFLEDLSDALPIDLTDAQTTSGFFVGMALCQQSECLHLTLAMERSFAAISCLPHASIFSFLNANVSYLATTMELQEWRVPVFLPLWMFMFQGLELRKTHPVFNI